MSVNRVINIGMLGECYFRNQGAKSKDKRQKNNIVVSPKKKVMLRVSYHICLAFNPIIPSCRMLTPPPSPLLLISPPLRRLLRRHLRSYRHLVSAVH